MSLLSDISPCEEGQRHDPAISDKELMVNMILILAIF